MRLTSSVVHQLVEAQAGTFRRDEQGPVEVRLDPLHERAGGRPLRRLAVGVSVVPPGKWPDGVTTRQPMIRDAGEPDADLADDHKGVPWENASAWMG
jgi:hypothetical protein